jgi:Biotin/lipoate A/B protein ligase family
MLVSDEKDGSADALHPPGPVGGPDRPRWAGANGVRRDFAAHSAESCSARLSVGPALGPDLPLCRRWTGGGVVIHEGDFTFALVVPRAEPWAATAPSESYRQLHTAIVCVLQAEGINASLARDRGEESGECFRAPVAHDVMAGGRKIVGGAQKRTRLGLLHQGSLQDAPTERGFAERLAGALSGDVFPWDPEQLEPGIRRLVAEKYANEEFLCGQRIE